MVKTAHRARIAGSRRRMLSATRGRRSAVDAGPRLRVVRSWRSAHSVRLDDSEALKSTTLTVLPCETSACGSGEAGKLRGKSCAALGYYPAASHSRAAYDTERALGITEIIRLKRNTGHTQELSHAIQCQVLQPWSTGTKRSQEQSGTLRVLWNSRAWREFCELK